jgi:predicted alpha/beta-hydrolase family hydrolase
MTEATEILRVSINDRDDVSALLYVARKQGRVAMTVILGHGAGANQLHPFMRLFASGLAERGFDAITFNFVYMEQGRRAPDPKAKLEVCYRAVIAAATQHKKLKGNRVVIGGKSMGGRIASEVAAANSLECGDSSPLSKALTSQRTPNLKAETTHASIEGKTDSNQRDKVNIAALVFLGYPLHPPGKPEQLRDAHLKDIHAPMLFVQGSRDAFGTPDELRAVIKRDRLRATLHVIEDGDHSLKVPKSTRITQQQVYDSAMDEIAHWLKTEVRNPEQ